MKLTCLSKGNGTYHFPPSHILQLSGFRILLECPLDLSSLAAFSPINAHHPTPLIKSTPFYKTLKNLHLWDPSLIDAVIVSTRTGMLGLPFLVKGGRFKGRVYASEVTARMGRMMMEELVEMNDEYVRFYGRTGEVPEWLKWEEVQRMHEEVREVVAGRNGDELASWMPLYSATDIKECMQSVQPLKNAEEACFNGTIMLKAFSSGLEIGSCNWTINGPRTSIAYLSSSIFQSAHAMEFDYYSLCGKDFVLFSDLSSLNSTVSNSNNMCMSNRDDKTGEKDFLSVDASQFRASAATDNEGENMNSFIDSSESLEEISRIDFICSCAVDSLNGGGSVLIPIGRLEIVLLLLEQISQSLEASNLKVPIFMISSTAEEMLAFTNVVPEWLCRQRQEKLFSGDALFGHVELMRERKLNLFPLLYSELLMMWKEPCIVFSPHWSLRLGPVVHLLHRWHADNRCLLILEQGVDTEAALMPFKPVAIRILQCSFLSGITVDKIRPLLEVLQPKLVMLPEYMQSLCPAVNTPLCPAVNTPFLYYSENITIRVPKFKDNFEVSLAADFALQLRPKKLSLNKKDLALARLTGGRLLLRNGKYSLVSSGVESATLLSNERSKLYWGRVDPDRLLSALQKKGIDGSLVVAGDNKTTLESDEIVYSIRFNAHCDAVIRTSATQTVICCDDDSVASVICEALSTVCDGI